MSVRVGCTFAACAQVLTSLGGDKLTEEEAEMMIKIVDSDGDGVLEYSEIIAVLRDQFGLIRD